MCKRLACASCVCVYADELARSHRTLGRLCGDRQRCAHTIFSTIRGATNAAGPCCASIDGTTGVWSTQTGRFLFGPNSFAFNFALYCHQFIAHATSVYFRSCSSNDDSAACASVRYVRSSRLNISDFRKNRFVSCHIFRIGYNPIPGQTRSPCADCRPTKRIAIVGWNYDFLIPSNMNFVNKS